MKEQKYLRNTDSGIIELYSEPKAALSNMEEVSKKEALAASKAKPKKAASNDSRTNEIKAAIDKLDKDDPDAFTASGKPQVVAIEAILGFDITAEERDSAIV